VSAVGPRESGTKHRGVAERDQVPDGIVTEMLVVQGVLQKVFAVSIEFFFEMILVRHPLGDALPSDGFQRRRRLDALNVKPPLRHVVVHSDIELRNALVWRVTKRDLRVEGVLIAFAEESFQESAHLVIRDVRRSV
jgi:hypothetical protein